MLAATADQLNEGALLGVALTVIGSIVVAIISTRGAREARRASKQTATTNGTTLGAYVEQIAETTRLTYDVVVAHNHLDEARFEAIHRRLDRLETRTAATDAALERHHPKELAADD